MRYFPVLLLVLGISFPSRADEAETIRALKKAGVQMFERGSAIPDAPKAPSGAILDVRPYGRSVEFITVLRDLPHLWSVNISDSPIKDEHLKELKDIKTLRRIFASKTKITDAGLDHIVGMELDYLCINRCAITDEGLKTIMKIKTLKGLELVGSKITDAGLMELKECKNLKDLFIGNTRTTPAGIKKLQAALPKCKISTAVINSD